MKKWIQRYIPVVLISFFFYSMLSTRHSRPLGDIIIESFGLPAWTDGNKGMHIALFVFLLFIIITFVIRDKFIVEEYILRGKQQFIIFVIIVTCIYFVHSGIVQFTLGRYDDLNSIVMKDDCYFNYSYRDGVLSDFTLQFELKNYSSEIREFEVVLDFLDFDNQGIEFTSTRNLRFVISGNDTKSFQINRDEYEISLDTKLDNSSFGGSGQVEYITLKDDSDKIYIIKSMNGTGKDSYF